MSFSFGFSGDDIEDDGEEAQEHEALASRLSEYTLSDPGKKSPPHSIIAVHPERHSLEELLASLPSQISYSKLHISKSANHGVADSNSDADDDHTVNRLYRRSVFDIRAQLMVEANPSAEEEDTAKTLLSGLESGDLSTGIYEGGFKTWECALDLASLIDSEFDHAARCDRHPGDFAEDWEILELGAGSAVPSLMFMHKFLERRRGRKVTEDGGGSIKITLCDYNADVLRLATAPNVFLNYLFASGTVTARDEDSWDGGDLDLEALGGEAFVINTIRDMASDNISFDFISGGWGPEFLDLVIPPDAKGASPLSESQLRAGRMAKDQRRPTNLLILASETIYSPTSIKTFSETVLNLLLASSHYRRFGTGTRAGPGTETDQAPPGPKAWVAAKRVYFGVGGGVDEFVSEMDRLGGRSRVVMDTTTQDAAAGGGGGGVGRVVLEVTLSAPPPIFSTAAASIT
ncbi:uncharacterized protein Z519_07076 [Cladophialophora bantiana CBS 173.52]|uniref:protein-histidine N-methyltransferase n=1 Tax=Cladophialophora bantiana (strain ATCC 10958 / CBS 173.52 / CDC B-1940 / NIH 8579) TaxID=1442370 RepID=A0A0D2G046_CLAB1|nr:uncharacterized protein Z519_07076 [Cladophialophora bantiana CBS 173.52]KIW92092.1 hypothetical protein Z519_07076 [Cladophialophora bantiana CBS 173.52]